MDYLKQIDLLELKMMQFDQNDAKRILHFMNVHRYAQLIGHMEHLDEHTQFLTECAALVHDIGIRPAEQKYGLCTGTLQEQEGPAYARILLEECHLPQKDIDRICYLVGHHHTYTQISGIDYQILIEADFLVNFYEDSMSLETIRTTMDKIFRTESGRKLCQIAYFQNGQ